MKKIIFYFLILFTFHAASAQTDNDAIKKTFEEYFKTIEQQNNAKTLDYIYPKLFEQFPKEFMLKAMNETTNDTTTHIVMSNSVIKNVSKTLTIENIQYALIKYSFTMTITETDKDDSIEFMLKLFQGTYGKNNVLYDKSTKKIEVHIDNEAYAINHPEFQGWKFLEKKESMKPVLEKLLPKKVLKKL